jgi:hypothetical protein
MLDMAKCDMTRQLLSVNGRFANQQLRKAPSAEAEKKPKEAKKPRNRETEKTLSEDGPCPIFIGAEERDAAAGMGVCLRSSMNGIKNWLGSQATARDPFSCFLTRNTSSNTEPPNQSIGLDSFAACRSSLSRGGRCRGPQLTPSSGPVAK